jgi:thiamine-phosphate diphosphorylase
MPPFEPGRRLVRLPALVVVADSAETGGRPLVRVVTEAVLGGARAVWLRDKQVAPDARRQVAAELAELLHGAGGWLVASPGPGHESADGCQLGADDPWPGPAGSPGEFPGGVGRSCHNRPDLVQAAAEGCEWATLSPIFSSTSKPGYGPALGPAALTGTPLPTWALGGVDEANAAECLRAGAAGVAVMGAVMRAPDPARAVARIQARLEQAGP